MNFFLKSILLLSFIFKMQTGSCQYKIPHIQQKGNVTQLIVKDKPFIILGGELGNSSASTMEYMKPVWQKLKIMNLNTVLIPVYWELLEPKEGSFDFLLVDQLIDEARKNDLKIVFLWFASWKNSMSSHVPSWIKTNQKKYPRVKDDKGNSYEILTPFDDSNLRADLTAFKALMLHLKIKDEKDQTVIMIQPENEIGMLPTARDYHPLANKKFNEPIPQEFIQYLDKNKNKLTPEFHAVWSKYGFKKSGTWEDVFGKDLHTDEIFMAWHFAKYTNEIVKAGKEVYPLPMFVNAALNRPDVKPGDYPSAGPLPHVMDVWKAAARDIDLLSPDFYNPNFKHWNDLYTRQNNPLFIPEHQFDNTVAAKSAFAIGHYNAIGFSPFSIESVSKPEEEPLGKMYNLISQLSPIITSNQGQNKIEGILLNGESQDTIIKLGKYEFTFRHDYTLKWSSGAKVKKSDWPFVGAIIVQTGENEFYVAGSGIVITSKYLNNDSLNVGILKVEEGMFENNKWKTRRFLNGDQTHQGRHLNIPFGEYMIQRFELYTFR